METSPSPFVSVCIPAYRAERYLLAALESVAAQTFKDWEIIVTEDGSRDRAETIVQEFARSVSQSVRYTRHDVNRGLPETRNTGIAAARGAWIAFLDADDLWKPEHLGGLVARTRESECDLVFAGTLPFDDATGAQLTPVAPTAEDLKNLPTALYTGRTAILPSSVMIRREVFPRIGKIDSRYPALNDSEYWLRLLRAGGRFGFSGQITLLYRKHAAAMSARAVAMLTESAHLCEQYWDWSAIPFHIRRGRTAEMYRCAGRIALESNPAQARALYAGAVRANPLWLPAWLQWAKARARSAAGRGSKTA